MNWDLWQGQTPDVPYIKERCHYTFRWWYEYSGGQLTDWGAHGIDIAHWGMGVQYSGPQEIDGHADELPSDPTATTCRRSSASTTATPGDITLKIRSAKDGLASSSRGTRADCSSTAARSPARRSISSRRTRSPGKVPALYGYDNSSRPDRTGKLDAIINHMGNFFDCVVSRKTPISDVVSQHRCVSTCHLGNISIRLKRKLTWDPQAEQFVGDDEANRWLKRERARDSKLFENRRSPANRELCLLLDISRCGSTRRIGIYECIAIAHRSSPMAAAGWPLALGAGLAGHRYGGQFRRERLERWCPLN